MTITVTVEVDADDVLSELTDKDLETELANRHDTPSRDRAEIIGDLARILRAHNIVPRLELREAIYDIVGVIV